MASWLLFEHGPCCKNYKQLLESERSKRNGQKFSLRMAIGPREISCFRFRISNM